MFFKLKMNSSIDGRQDIKLVTFVFETCAPQQCMDKLHVQTRSLIIFTPKIQKDVSSNSNDTACRTTE